MFYENFVREICVARREMNRPEDDSFTPYAWERRQKHEESVRHWSYQHYDLLHWMTIGGWEREYGELLTSSYSDTPYRQREWVR